MDKNNSKIKKLEQCLVCAAKNNLESFEFEGNKYSVTVFGNYVQTLIDNRILYRIPIEDSTKDQSKTALF